MAEDERAALRGCRTQPDRARTETWIPDAVAMMSGFDSGIDLKLEECGETGGSGQNRLSSSGRSVGRATSSQRGGLEVVGARHSELEELELGHLGDRVSAEKAGESRLQP